MPDLSDAGLDAAFVRGRALERWEPRAASARYEAGTGQIVIELTNGCSFAFPTRLAEGLQDATDEQLRAVEVLGAGYGLHWEALDADLSVPGLLAGRFGTRAFMEGRRAQPRARAGD